jgi:hypothetical protein
MLNKRTDKINARNSENYPKIPAKGHPSIVLAAVDKMATCQKSEKKNRIKS